MLFIILIFIKEGDFIKRNFNFHNKEIGNIGEEVAVQYLEKIGYNILERNFFSNNGEIDIVAKDKNEYVFIEVKTRISKKYGTPIEAVNKYKEKHIIMTSRYYIYKYALNKCFIRFDIIEVYINERDNLINHIKNVFF